MAVPSEYKFEKTVRKADNLIIHQASHPIHGKVTIYMPDDTVAPEIAVTVKRYLYQNGIRMRNISQLQIPLVARTLEVSQNPDEPYIVSEYKKNNLQDLINNRTTLKPKRIFRILSQILKAVTSLSKEGWKTNDLQAYQILLRDINEGDVSFTAFEGTPSQENIEKAMTDTGEGDETETLTIERRKEQAPPNTEEQNTRQTFETGRERAPAKASTITEPRSNAPAPPEKELRSVQRNIYILGEIAYQLLFGNEYRLSDNTAVVNIQKLSSRWRMVVSKSLNPSLENRYETYEAMLSDINKALTRNKKIAIGLTPVFVLLVGVGALLGYNQYHRHKIMTSEAGQAIESFLNIVNKTGSEFAPPLEPLPGPAEPNDDDILKPFEEITTLGEED